MNDPLSPREQSFEALRWLLYRWAPPLLVDVDEPDHYSLITRLQKKTGTPLRFGSTRILKTYVSFKFTPLHLNPELGANLSPALLKRKQGLYSFNFDEPMPALFDELRAMVKKGYEEFVVRGYIGFPEIRRLDGPLR
ncbi:MAG: hypothetical protein AAF610_04245 [Pseudomonadota bacterium]